MLLIAFIPDADSRKATIPLNTSAPALCWWHQMTESDASSTSVHYSKQSSDPLQQYRRKPLNFHGFKIKSLPFFSRLFSSVNQSEAACAQPLVFNMTSSSNWISAWGSSSRTASNSLWLQAWLSDGKPNWPCLIVLPVIAGNWMETEYVTVACLPWFSAATENLVH